MLIPRTWNQLPDQVRDWLAVRLERRAQVTYSEYDRGEALVITFKTKSGKRRRWHVSFYEEQF